MAIRKPMLNTEHGVNSFITFSTNLRVTYPALYNHIFGGADALDSVSPLIFFLESIDKSDLVQFDKIWSYFVANEHKHLWWML